MLGLIINLRKCFKATEAQLKAAEIANEGITLEYDSGNTRTTLEVIQSRSLLLDARIAFAKAERDFMISKFELAFQIGTLSLSSIKHYNPLIFTYFFLIDLEKRTKCVHLLLSI